MSNINKFVLSGDDHIKLQTWSSIPRIRGDAYYSFKKKIDYCIEHGIPLVDAGDTFDNKTPSSFDVKFVGDQLRRMNSAGLPVYVIQGQHDQSDPCWMYTAAPDCIKHVDKQVFEPVPGLKIYARDAMKRKEAEASIEDIPPECNAVMMHQLCKEVFDKEGSWDFSIETLPPNIKTALCADFHSPVDVMVEREGYAPCRLIYTGSAHVCKIDEDPAKVITVIEHVGGGDIKVERVPILARPYINVSVKTEDQLILALDYLRSLDIAAMCPPDMPKEMQYAVVYLKFPFSLPDAAGRVSAALAGKGHVWEEVYGEVSALSSNEEAPPEQGVVLEECLARFLEPGSPAFELTRDLLKTSSPGIVFEDWRKKMDLVSGKTI